MSKFLYLILIDYWCIFIIYMVNVYKKKKKIFIDFRLIGVVVYCY